MLYCIQLHDSCLRACVNLAATLSYVLPAAAAAVTVNQRIDLSEARAKQ